MSKIIRIDREFPVLSTTREKYVIPTALLGPSGKLVLSNFRSIQVFTDWISTHQKQGQDRYIKAGQLNAMVLIEQILHYVLLKYVTEKNPDFFEKACQWLENRMVETELNSVFLKHTACFPCLDIIKGKTSVHDYQDGMFEGKPVKLLVLEQLLLLMLDNENPAFSPAVELFDDTVLKTSTSYSLLLNTFESFSASEPTFGPLNQKLFDLLRSPFKAFPDSLEEQLSFIRKNWGSLISEEMLGIILMAIDTMSEENKIILPGKGPAEVLEFSTGKNGYHEPEAFSDELDWMSQIVIIAKNVFVWFDQLSKKYGRSITRLDQIPDEELDLLSGWGFTGLWLIGLWKRSPASQKIKQICGNPEALASAYSLYDYVIDDELGGEDALSSLQSRAWNRGIRLASDMVPNHMGIYSKWVIEYPDRFLQLDHPPYPAYKFSGPDLSWDNRTGLFIEDGYWDKNDAAVVFKRVDNDTGKTTYLYHGNDGTSMLWNDTAQLDFLKAEVREAVIQTILHVARMFPIIRFDAAMTLAKRHFQRLWYPQPGTGGDIPSRSQFSKTDEEFNRLFPVEFWREVVDRINDEVPDTLLLAEAFWLMEGYFVRTLGMHRVYNSAFMNMLKTEENDKYRSVIKNVLEYNPEILRRFVNFMNNPDEDTAYSQFGDGDKYFGVVMMMVTLPGLPMFGHGQIECFKEKYGMEYRKAYMDEEINWNFLKRHEKEIFPLLRLRHLFSGVRNFLLYDFFLDNGGVDENVYAYSNVSGNDRALILYNNRYQSTAGWIRYSAAFSSTGDDSENRELIRKDIVSGLGLQNSDQWFVRFRDLRTNLEYIRSNTEMGENGFFTELAGYEYRLFTEFKEIRDDPDGNYSQLNLYLNGSGVPDLDDLLTEMKLEPVHRDLKKILNSDFFNTIHDIFNSKSGREECIRKTNEILAKPLEGLFHWIENDPGMTADADKIIPQLGKFSFVITKYEMLLHDTLSQNTNLYHKILNYLNPVIDDNVQTKPDSRFILYIGMMLNLLDSMDEPGHDKLSILKTWQLHKVIPHIFTESGVDEFRAHRLFRLIRILIIHQSWGAKLLDTNLHTALSSLFDDESVQDLLGFNIHNNTLWFNKESFSDLLFWLFNVSVIKLLSREDFDSLNIKQLNSRLTILFENVSRANITATQSGYQVEQLLKLLN